MGVAGKGRSDPQSAMKVRFEASNSKGRKLSCGPRILWTFPVIVHQTALDCRDDTKMLPFCRAQTFVNSAFVQPRADVYLAVKWGTTGQPAMDKNLVHVISLSLAGFGSTATHVSICQKNRLYLMTEAASELMLGRSLLPRIALIDSR